jgi:hypothetical protein
MEILMIQVVLMKINKKYITVEPLLKTIKIQYIYSSIGDSEVVLVFERNNPGLKKPLSFVSTDK